MDDERRRHPRQPLSVPLRFSVQELEPTARDYLEGIAHDASLGGMFIATDGPSPKGSVVTLEFSPLTAKERPVSITAIVRWRRRWREPRGMGVEFVELEGIEAENLESWLSDLDARLADADEG